MQVGGRLKKLFRWRLRTLLLLITLTGCCLAFYTKWIQPYRVQFDARRKLESIGGSVRAEAAEPAWMAKLVGNEQFHRVVQYRLRRDTAGDQDIAPIADLPHLRRLYLDRSGVGDRGAFYIGRLQHLERLALWHTRITDAGLPHIARCIQLQVLDLHSTCITDRGLAPLERLRNLRQLKLGGAVCGPGLTSIAKLPVLAKLDLTQTPIRFEALAALAGSPIEDIWITREMPASVAGHLSKLPRLCDFHGTILGADNRTVSQLANCLDLRAVSLTGGGLTDVGVAHLARLPRLAKLSVAGNLTDATIRGVAVMHQLKQAHLTGRFSLEAVDRLVQKRPKLSLTVKTLLPAAYYLDSRKLRLFNACSNELPGAFTKRHLQVSSLMHIVRSRSNARRIRGALSAFIQFPATIADLARLTVLRDRMESIRVNPLRHFPGDYVFDSEDRGADETAGQSPPGRPFEWSLDGIEQFSNLQSLHIHCVARNQFARLEGLGNLIELRIIDRSLRDEDLDLLRLPTSLRKLFITSPHVSREGFAKLSRRYADVQITCQSLGKWWSAYRWRKGALDACTQQAGAKTVRVAADRATVDCDPLSTLPNLNGLHISGYVPHQPVWHLRKQLPALEDLSLVCATDCDVAQLRLCPSLKSLFFDRTSISDNAFEHFAQLPKLQKLDVHGTWITGRTLDQLSACPHLKLLDLSRTHVRQRYLANLASLKHLKELNLSRTRIGDESCAQLAKLPALEILNISYTNVTDAGMEHLAGCSRLQQLDISCTHITDKGLECLSQCAALRVLTLRHTATTADGLRPFAGRFPAVQLRPDTSN